jgi:hypothetical protein
MKSFERAPSGEKCEDILFDNNSETSLSVKLVYADQWEHSNTEALMKEWGEKAAGLRWMHLTSAVHWRSVDKRLTLIGIGISAIVSASSLIGASEFLPNSYIMTGVGFIGMLSILNQSIARFYNSVEKSTLHDTAARDFGNLNRLIKTKMSLARIDRGNPRNFMRYILKENEKLFKVHLDPHPCSVLDFRRTFHNKDFIFPDNVGDTFKINVYDNLNDVYKDKSGKSYKKGKISFEDISSKGNQDNPLFVVI